MNYWEIDHMSGAWAIVMVLHMVGFWVLLAVVFVWAIGSSGSPYARATRAQMSTSDGTTGPAEQTLARRVALGEIDPDGCLRKLAALRSDGAS